MKFRERTLKNNIEAQLFRSEMQTCTINKQSGLFDGTRLHYRNAFVTKGRVLKILNRRANLPR
jgi:hypothetical protein